MCTFATKSMKICFPSSIMHAAKHLQFGYQMLQQQQQSSQPSKLHCFSTLRNNTGNQNEIFHSLIKHRSLNTKAEFVQQAELAVAVSRYINIFLSQKLSELIADSSIFSKQPAKASKNLILNPNNFFLILKQKQKLFL